jgi:UDP-N-acetylglucosamine 4,6-dehydratase
MAKADDLGDYYRIPADNRTLNYEKFMDNGDATIERGWEYTSHNTTRLNVEQVKELLLKLPYIKSELANGAAL